MEKFEMDSFEMNINLNRIYDELVQNYDILSIECIISNTYRRYNCKYKTLTISFDTNTNPCIMSNAGWLLNYNVFRFFDGVFRIEFNTGDFFLMKNSTVIDSICNFIYKAQLQRPDYGTNQKIVDFNRYFKTK